MSLSQSVKIIQKHFGIKKERGVHFDCIEESLFSLKVLKVVGQYTLSSDKYLLACCISITQFLLPLA